MQLFLRAAGTLKTLDHIIDEVTVFATAKHRVTGRLRIRMITPAWGEFYINRWLDLAFAALRSEGNIPYFNEHCDFELAVITRTPDVTFMQADPRFKSVMAGLRLRFITIDEFFPPHGNISYGIPLTLAYGKAIKDIGEDGLGSYVILLNADFVVASGSMRGLLRKIRQGYTAISAASIRVIDAGASLAKLGLRCRRRSTFERACFRFRRAQ